MVKIDKFIFDLDGRKIELTEDECINLKVKLNELFGQPMTPYYPVCPQPSYPEPSYPQPYRPTPIWYETKIT